MKKSKMEKSNKKVKTRKLEKTRKSHRHFWLIFWHFYDLYKMDVVTELFFVRFHVI